jgi:hypothetical protein
LVSQRGGSYVELYVLPRSRREDLRRPGEIAGVEACLHQTDAQTIETILGESDSNGFVAGRRPHGRLMLARAGGEIDELPFGGHLGRESANGVGSMITPKMRLLRLLASRNSARHHFDAAHSGETSKITSSQRSAACFKAACHLSPALRPRSGSRSRKRSS